MEELAVESHADRFWKWFIEHEELLFSLDCECESERERVFDQLVSALQRVHQDLTFEFGPLSESRQFVISAAGLKRAFPAVINLVQAAPTLSRWRIIPFRPRRNPINAIQINEKRIDPADVQFSLLDNGANAGIYLFIPGFMESDVDFKQIGYLFLDETLGEYDVETNLGLIKMMAPEARTAGERHPLVQLSALFDQLVARLTARTEKRS